jgi:hypothetical protein
MAYDINKKWFCYQVNLDADTSFSDNLVTFYPAICTFIQITNYGPDPVQVQINGANGSNPTNYMLLENGTTQALNNADVYINSISWRSHPASGSGSGFALQVVGATSVV